MLAFEAIPKYLRPMPPQSILNISDLTLLVHMGCTPAERVKKQEVRISFQIKPGRLPGACLSDELSETICYETLIDSISRLVTSQSEFKTVEKFALVCFQNLKSQMPPDALLSLSAQKVNPPIDSLKGGVLFQLADERFES